VIGQNCSTNPFDPIVDPKRPPPSLANGGRANAMQLLQAVAGQQAHAATQCVAADTLGDSTRIGETNIMKAVTP
jgi:hypothetical protein